MSHVETADAADRSPYPRRWGVPPGTPTSEERAAWVRRHVNVERARNAQRSAADRALLAHRASPADPALALEAAREAERQ